MFEIRSDEARAHGLPAIEVRVDAQTAHMIGSRFPRPGWYLAASGPPGAPLMFFVAHSDEVESDWAAIERAVRAGLRGTGDDPFLVGEHGYLDIAGERRCALAFVTGRDLSSTAWCAVLITTGEGTVLASLGRAAGRHGPMPCAEVAAQPSLSVLVATLMVRTGAETNADTEPTDLDSRPSDPDDEDAGSLLGLAAAPATLDVRGWRDALAQRGSLPRALGALLGMAVGDALGTTYEFQATEAPPFPTLATGLLRDVVGGGPFKLEAGQVTDDTQMAIALADALIEDEPFSASALAARYVAWSHVAFDVGVQVHQGLALIERGWPAERAGRRVWEERRRFPAGNGSLMRTAVIGALLAGLPDARRRLSLAESAITHFDPRCQLACAVMNAAIADAVMERGTPTSMVRAAIDELAPAAALMRSWYPDIAREIDAAEALLRGDLSAAHRDDPCLYGDELHLHRTAGFVRVAFRLAFWELLHAPDLRAALIDVANRGGDADTNAAITGALLGACYGVAAVPAEWITRVLTAPGLEAAGSAPVPVPAGQRAPTSSGQTVSARPPRRASSASPAERDPEVRGVLDLHPRAFLRTLAKGFAADRDPSVAATLAPFIATAFPALASTREHAMWLDGHAVSSARPAPLAAFRGTMIAGWHLVHGLRGEARLGQARCVGPDGLRAIATFTLPQSSPLVEVARRLSPTTPGVAPVLAVISADVAGRRAMLVEAEPMGIPLATPGFPMAPRDALAPFAQLAAIVAASHASGLVLGGLRPELIYVARGASGPVVTGVVPRWAAFAAGAAWPRELVTEYPFDAVYASPEVCAGAPALPCADVFSLCAVLLYLLRRRVPHQDAGEAPMAQVDFMTHRQPPRVDELPAPLGDAIRDGLHPEVHQRAGLDQIIAALARVGVGVPPPPAFVPSRWI